MNGNTTIAVIGGDMRQLTVADFFKSKGYDVLTWGTSHNKKTSNATDGKNKLEEILMEADICILPLPVSNEGLRLNYPSANEKSPKLSEVAELICNSTTVFGGKIPPGFSSQLKEKDCNVIDYFEDECLCIKNALLTAEAAIEIAMREYHGTVDSSKSMVIGYGRIGKLLTNLLIKMNSEVTVSARKETDLAYASCMGADTIKLESETHEELNEINNGYDIVFNTVPVRIFNDELINSLNKKTVIIDLASSPGCMDIRQAREKGLNVIRALSLPGKYSPIRAGKIISETIYNKLTEIGL